MKRINVSDHPLIVIFLVAIAVFTLGLLPEFQALDARFALFAQEMLRNGPTFFPTTYGEPYPDYPGTSTFLIFLCSLPFGRVTPFSAILPTAVASALVLVMIYRIGAMHSKEWALWAVLLAFFTQSFFSLSRHISPDLYVALVTVVCFYIIYSSTVYRKTARVGWLPVLMFTGFAFRGPIGLLIPAAVVCGYYALETDFKKMLIMIGTAGTVLAVGVVGLLAAARYQGGDAFVHTVISSQVTGRIPASHSIFSYWIGGLTEYAVSYPLALIVLIVKRRDVWKRKTKDDRLLAHLALWILIVLGGMSIPGDKKMRYILPALPAFVLAGAYAFKLAASGDALQSVKTGFLKFCYYYPFAVTVLSLSTWIAWSWLPVDFKVHALASLLAMLIVSIMMLVLLSKVRQSGTKDMIKMGSAVVTFFVFSICYSDQYSYYQHLSRPFVNKVASVLEEQGGTLAFYRIGRDYGAVKFLVNYERPIEPAFVGAPDEISTSESPTVFVAKQEDFNVLLKELPGESRVLAQGQLDKQDCVLFSYIKPL